MEGFQKFKGLLLLALCAEGSKGSEAFAQYGSDRYFLSQAASKPSPAAPWPSLPLPSLAEMVMSTEPGLVVARSVAGGVYLLDRGGNVSTVALEESLGPAVWAGSFKVTAGHGVVACGSHGCSWFVCRELSCGPAMGSTKWSGAGATAVVAASDGTVFGAAPSGIWRLERPLGGR